MRWLLVILFSLNPVLASAKCEFKTADYIEAMANPESIKLIDIEIHKKKNTFAMFLKYYLRNLVTFQRSLKEPSKLMWPLLIALVYVGIVERSGNMET